MYRTIVLSVLLLLPRLTFGPTRQEPTRPSPAGTTIVRPRLADSATGYIDNAIIGQQIRIRFDAGYDINSPDRAEFFYAKCGCFRFLSPNNPNFDPNAPGPGSTPTQAETNLNYQEYTFDGEFMVHNRVSVFGEFPIRS